MMSSRICLNSRVFILCLLVLSTTWAADFLCSKDFCVNYLEKNECMSVGDACQVQDEDKNGELFSGEVPCGCCQVCLENLKYGNYCTIGSPDVTPPLLVCGPGLYCEKGDDNEFRCQNMKHTTCFKDQILYDIKTSPGSFMSRPQCDGDGLYRHVKCNINQTCFCINDEGDRIFGEAVYSRATELSMNCECSRIHNKYNNLMEGQLRMPALTSRCLEDGSFDPLQCMDNLCACVEEETGYPETDRYEMKDIKYSALPCFNRSYHLDYKYLHRCEEIISDLVNEFKESEDLGYTIFDVELPKCYPDGWFHQIQSNKEEFYCADKYGAVINEFRVAKTDPSAHTMNCYCARTRNLLLHNDARHLPKCCPNGNFEKVQCRNGVCYCVDENGLQIDMEVTEIDAEQLSCYNNGTFC